MTPLNRILMTATVFTLCALGLANVFTHIAPTMPADWRGIFSTAGASVVVFWAGALTEFS